MMQMDEDDISSLANPCYQSQAMSRPGVMPTLSSYAVDFKKA